MLARWLPTETPFLPQNTEPRLSVTTCADACPQSSPGSRLGRQARLLWFWHAAPPPTEQLWCLAFGGRRGAACACHGIRDVVRGTSAGRIRLSAGVRGSALVVRVLEYPWGTCMCHGHSNVSNAQFSNPNWASLTVVHG